MSLAIGITGGRFGGGGGGSAPSLSVAVSDANPQAGTSITITATPSAGFTPVRYFAEAHNGTNLIYIGENGTGIFNWLVSEVGTLSIFVYVDDGTTTSAYNIGGETVIVSFNPLALTSPVAGYDASDASTITIATGVSAIDNLVSGGQAITQGSGASQPSVVSAYQNGLDAIKFDGTNDFLATSTALLSNNDYYIAIACRPVAEAVTRGIFSQFTSGAAGRMTLTSNQNVGGATALGLINPFINGSTGLSDFAFTTSNLIIEFESAFGTLEVRLNGTVVAGGTTAVNILATVFRLGTSSGSSAFFNGHFYEMWAYNSSQTTVNKNGMVAYLQSKWAI